MSSDRSIDGFNIGVNSDASAGETISHVHVHTPEAVSVVSRNGRATLPIEALAGTSAG